MVAKREMKWIGAHHAPAFPNDSQASDSQHCVHPCSIVGIKWTVRSRLGRRHATIPWKCCLCDVWHMALSLLFHSPGPPDVPGSGRYDYSNFPCVRLRLSVVTGLCMVVLGPEPSRSQCVPLTPALWTRRFLTEPCFPCLLAAIPPFVSGSLLHLNVFLIFSRAEVTLCVRGSPHSLLSALARKSRNSKKQQWSLLAPL